MQQPVNSFTDVIRNAVLSDPVLPQTQNTVQIIRDAAQISEEAAKVAQDAVQVVQDVQQTQNENTPVPPAPLQTDDSRLNALITRLASTNPSQVQQFQIARQEIQALQVQATEVPVSPQNAQTLLVSAVQPSLPGSSSDALFLFQQSMQGTLQALNTASTVLGQYTQSVERNTLLPSKPALQIQANLAQSYGKEALTLLNLAQNVVPTPPTQLTGTAPTVLAAAGPLDSASSIVSQGLEIVKVLAPLLELLPALFL